MMIKGIVGVLSIFIIITYFAVLPILLAMETEEVLKNNVSHDNVN